MKHYRAYVQDGIEPKVEYDTYEVVKETPCGYWIVHEYDIPLYDYDIKRRYFLKDHTRWVHKHSRKRYAYPTKKEALNSLIIRRTRQVDILKARLDQANMELAVAKGIKPTTFKECGDLPNFVQDYIDR